MIHTFYDLEADVWVGEDIETGVMSQGLTENEAVQATISAIKMHSKAVEFLKQKRPGGNDAD